MVMGWWSCGGRVDFFFVVCVWGGAAKHRPLCSCPPCRPPASRCCRCRAKWIWMWTGMTPAGAELALTHSPPRSILRNLVPLRLRRCRPSAAATSAVTYPPAENVPATVCACLLSGALIFISIHTK